MATISIPSGLLHLGDQTLTVDDTVGGVALTLPTGAYYAYMTLETADIRWRLSSAAPTTLVGSLLSAPNDLTLTGDAQLTGFRAIKTGSTNGKLTINYFKAPPV